MIRLRATIRAIHLVFRITCTQNLTPETTLHKNHKRLDEKCDEEIKGAGLVKFEIESCDQVLL
jgi:hypothetical protein